MTVYSRTHSPMQGSPDPLREASRCPRCLSLAVIPASDGPYCLHCGWDGPGREALPYVHAHKTKGE